MEGASVKDRVLSLQGKAGSSTASLRFVSYHSFQCSFAIALLLLINLFGRRQRKIRSLKLEPDCPFKNAQMRACKTLIRRRIRQSPLESSMLPSRPSERIASQSLFQNQIDHPWHRLDSRPHSNGLLHSEHFKLQPPLLNERVQPTRHPSDLPYGHIQRNRPELSSRTVLAHCSQNPL
jgi:hypothetical protein